MKKILQIMPLPANLAAVIRYVDEEHNVGYEHLNSHSDQRCCLLALVYNTESEEQSVVPLIWWEESFSFLPDQICSNEEIQIVSKEWLEFNDYNYSEIFFSEL